MKNLITSALGETSLALRARTKVSALFMSDRRRVSRELEKLIESAEDNAEVKIALEKAIEDLGSTKVRDPWASTSASLALLLYEKEIRRLPSAIRLKREMHKLLQKVTPVPEPQELSAAAQGSEIYVINVADKSAGVDTGSWVSPATSEKELGEQLEATVGGAGEDWVIQEYKEFPDLGERPDVKDLAIVSSLLDEHPLTVVKAALKREGSASEARTLLNSGYATFGSAEEYGRKYVADMGGPAELDPGTIMSYSDMDPILEKVKEKLKVVQLSDDSTFVFGAKTS